MLSRIPRYLVLENDLQVSRVSVDWYTSTEFGENVGSFQSDRVKEFRKFAWRNEKFTT